MKAASEFHKSKRRRLGLHIYCKTCCAAASASRAKTKQPVTQPTVDAKVCAESKPHKRETMACVACITLVYNLVEPTRLANSI